MGKDYSNTPGGNKLKRDKNVPTVRSCGNNLTCHYKQMSEVGRAIKGLKIQKAVEYLTRVTNKKDVIPYMVHKGGKARHAMAKNHKTGGSGFPLKSSQMMLKLLENLKSNTAQSSTFDSSDDLVLSHVQVNRAQKMRRRTYRAHGRMGPYVRNPCHVELCATSAKAKAVPVPIEAAAATKSRKLLAINRWKAHSKVPVGGGEKKAAQ